MVAAFDHRAADVRKSARAAKRQAQPDVLSSLEHSNPTRSARSLHYVEAADLDKALAAVGWTHDWLLAWKDITSPTNERTTIAAVLPRRGTNDSLPMFVAELAPDDLAFALCCLNSLPLDFVARQKVGGLHLRLHVFQQLPILPAGDPTVSNDLWPGAGVSAIAYVRERVLELTYTAWDLAGFAADLGYDGPPFRWDEERRALLRAELDALMFRLYGIGRDDVDYILDTFPIVKRKDEAAFGEYRTKRLILERFDAMAAADAAGHPYKTALDPPPADPTLAHPASTRPSWAALPTPPRR